MEDLIRVLWSIQHDEQLKKYRYIDECQYNTKFGPDVEKQLNLVENAIINQDIPNSFLYSAYIHMCYVTKNMDRVSNFTTQRYYPYLAQKRKEYSGKVYLEYFRDLHFRECKAKCGPIPEEVESLLFMFGRLELNLLILIMEKEECSCSWHKQYDHKLMERLMNKVVDKNRIMNNVALEVYEHILGQRKSSKSAN